MMRRYMIRRSDKYNIFKKDLPAYGCKKLYGQPVFYEKSLRSTPLVYFVVDVSSGWVKIGRSTNLVTRLESFMLCNPNPIQLVGIVKFSSVADSVEYEKDIHKQFSHENGRGEWFWMSDRLTSLIRTLKTPFVYHHGWSG